MDDNKLTGAGMHGVESVPVGELGVVYLHGTEELASYVDKFLVTWRKERENEHKDDLLFARYEKDTFLIESECPRFGTGEGKGVIKQSVRGDDLYFLVDVTNSSLDYSLQGSMNHYSPDDYYQDLKRLVAAASGHAKRMTVIMPFLYEGRQLTRRQAESLDCASMLKELTEMGVTNIITFDAHDPRVQNAIPLSGFENVSPTYQYLKTLLKTYKDIEIDPQHMLVVSPDENGMSRAIYFANILGVDAGMFYKRRDYTRIIDGEHPVVADEYLGPDVAGKDILIIDDMISSGDLCLDMARQLKRNHANRVFAFATFGFFTNGFEPFDEAYANGLIDRVFTTNLVYQAPELREKPWFRSVNMGKYIALIIDYLNHNYSVSTLINPVERINRRIAEYRKKKLISENDEQELTD